MQNHFSKGLMAGLTSEDVKPATELTRFCSDYKRGYVLGYAHHCAENSGDGNHAAYQAGLLCKEYGLDGELVAEFFSGGENRLPVRFFMAGYNAD
ncbi:DUF2623 family protein [Rahnella sp. SAP-1]|jgi:hypothetical protein|uniref:DUF2623 family protein n=1 Tax=Rouxiella aceris TaxID=2703884 RepID=A0A848MPI0_9GAMM|nr:DUF2623 family protein [Rouxiella aceris]NMP28941.1 DUF2623 family protein [Rouxiella aceris]